MYNHQSYTSIEYASSFEKDCQCVRLENSNGFVLKRQIPGSNRYDAMGLYPMFFCDDWFKLNEDLENNKDDLVSLVMVTDPFGKYDVELLNSCFNYLVKPFKKHFIVDLSRASENLNFFNKHNKRYAIKSHKVITVEKVDNPISFLGVWNELYSTLIDRHNIKGLAAFSEMSLKKQMIVPGSLVFSAKYKEEIVGITIWYKLGEVVYYHLGAYSQKGYEMRASYAMIWNVIEYFRSTDFKWLNLGGGAGFQSDGSDGLSRFKKGWSTGTKITYLCGHIFDKGSYDRLSILNRDYQGSYFPLYRLGEFN